MANRNGFAALTLTAFCGVFSATQPSAFASSDTRPLYYIGKRKDGSAFLIFRFDRDPKTGTKLARMGSGYIDRQTGFVTPIRVRRSDDSFEAEVYSQFRRVPTLSEKIVGKASPEGGFRGNWSRFEPTERTSSFEFAPIRTPDSQIQIKTRSVSFVNSWCLFHHESLAVESGMDESLRKKTNDAIEKSIRDVTEVTAKAFSLNDSEIKFGTVCVKDYAPGTDAAKSVQAAISWRLDVTPIYRSNRLLSFAIRETRAHGMIKNGTFTQLPGTINEPVPDYAYVTIDLQKGTRLRAGDVIDAKELGEKSAIKADDKSFAVTPIGLLSADRNQDFPDLVSFDRLGNKFVTKQLKAELEPCLPR